MKKFLSGVFLFIMMLPQVVSASGNYRAEFINKVAPEAKVLAEQNDLYASVMIAQAALETGFGTSYLAKNANNFFGVKGRYNNQFIVINTSEFDKQGNKYYINAEFRKYPSINYSLRDYVDFLTGKTAKWREAFYKGARFSVAKNYKEATKYLTGRYATAPTYDVALNKIIEEFNLTKYDKVKAKPVINTAPAVNVVKKPEVKVVTPTKEVAKPVEEKFTTKVNIVGYANAVDASKRVNGKTTYKAGTYFIYKKHNGMLNITTKKGVPGAWINPNPVVNKVAPKPAVKPAARKTYKVVKGDTLWGIANRNKLTVNKLKSLNKLNSNLIKVGMILYLN